MRLSRPLAACAALCLSTLAFGEAPPAVPAAGGTPAMTIVPDIEARRAQFVKKALTSDLAVLPAEEQRALRHLVAAAKLLHDVYRAQVWDGNLEFGRRVAQLSGPGAEAAKDYYRIMAKPWDALRGDEPFIGGVPKPPGASFWPDGFTQQELEAWAEKFPHEKPALVSPYTVVLRRPDGRLASVPFSKQWREPLQRVAAELESAARATRDKKLARFLKLRAEALLDNRYFESDMAWMDLDGAIEVVVGPYETYDDALLGLKASFEAFVCVVQPSESARLAAFKAELPALERALPIPDQHKNLARGTESPIRVADVVFSSGDARAGVQTLAFNLPNDERVREAKGSKKVLLRNMMQAKYEAILEPLAGLVLAEGGAARISFDAYFQFILMHEIAHGLGPGRIKLGERETEVRLELRELYPALEEAKADVLGVHALYALADKGVVAREVVEALPWTYVAGLFRTARFGTNSAHGQGVLLQTNYLIGKGAVVVGPDGRFAPVPARFRDGFRDLAHDLLMLQATGDYEGTKKFVAQYGTLPPAMAARIETLKALPVDVDPVYALFEKR